MLISIVTPSFRQLDWLRLAVASVRDQGANGLTIEHIVQDAGSPGIEDFAREVGADFYREGCLVFEASPAVPHPPHYRIAIHSEADNGMYDAVNRGFRRASGDVFAYLNCDEQYLPGVLRDIAMRFEALPSTDVLFGDAIVVDSQGRYLCDRPVTIPSVRHIRVSGNLSVFTAATFSRAAVFKTKNLFFDDAFKNVGDAEWVLRLLKARIAMRTVRLRVAAFTDTGENLNMQSGGFQEKEQLRAMAPCWTRAATPLIVAIHRLKRLLSGTYSLTPHAYEIFTRNSPAARVRFDVPRPSFIWPGR